MTCNQPSCQGMCFNSIRPLQDSLQTFPVEIVRSILEWAATCVPMGATLCRVSKLVFNWTVPISYHTVVLRDPEDTHSFDTALSSPGRSADYQHAVRCISLPRHGIPPGLSKCPSLRHIAFYAYDHFARFVMSLDRPMLSHLVIYDQSVYFHLQAPFSTHITHLVVSQQFMLRSLNISDFDFPNLTHFVTPILMNGPNNCVNAYRASFSQLFALPRLKVIGLMAYRVEFPFRKTVPEAEPDKSAILDMIGGQDEQRIAVFPRECIMDGDTWGKSCHSDMGVWDRAERLLLEQSFN